MMDITEKIENPKGLNFIWGDLQASLVVFRGDEVVGIQNLVQNTEAEALKVASKFLN